MHYFKEIKTRTSWLLVGLGLSLIIVEVVKNFEGTLKENLILAGFIPLVVYMCDAAGTQMEAIIIRALNQRVRFNFIKFFRQQVVIVVAVAFIIAILSGLLITLLNNSSGLGMVIGISLLAGIITSLLTGSLLPYLFWKLHKDPAEASGPVVTAIQDLLSVIIFLSVAQAIL